MPASCLSSCQPGPSATPAKMVGQECIATLQMCAAEYTLCTKTVIRPESNGLIAPSPSVVCICFIHQLPVSIQYARVLPCHPLQRQTLLIRTPLQDPCSPLPPHAVRMPSATRKSERDCEILRVAWTFPWFEHPCTSPRDTLSGVWKKPLETDVR